MLTKGAIGNLVNRYRAVLKKCNLINTFGSLAVASLLVLGGAGVAGAVELNIELKGQSITYDNATNKYLQSGYNSSQPNPINLIGTGTETVTLAGVMDQCAIASYGAGEVNVSNVKDIVLNGAWHSNDGVWTNYSGNIFYAQADKGNIAVVNVNMPNGTIKSDGVLDNAIVFHAQGGKLEVVAKSIDVKTTYVAVMAQGGGTINFTTSEDLAFDAQGGLTTNGSNSSIVVESRNVTLTNSNNNAGINLRGDSGNTITINADENINITGSSAININTTNANNTVTMNAKNIIITNNGEYYALRVNNGKLDINATDKTDIFGDIVAQGTGVVDIQFGTKGSLTGAVTTETNSSTTLDFGTDSTWNVTGDSTVTEIKGTGTIVVDSEDATINGAVAAGANISAKGSAALNDQTGGDLDEVKDAVSGLGITEDKITGMDEGLISGKVNADGTQEANTILVDTLDIATAAPLAVSRIVINDVRKRMGDLRDSKEEAGAWVRWEGGKLKGDSGLTNDFNTIQVGADMLTGIKNVRAGVAAAFTHGDLDHFNGDGEMETYSFSAYGTWMADNGMFADVIARVGFTNTEVTVKGMTADLDNEVFSLSAEYGWRLPICDQFFVEPQVELTYTYITSADYKLDYASYDIDSVDSLIGRAGAVFGWKLPNDRGSLYARASVVHEFLNDAEINATAFGRTESHSENGEDTWLEYGIGANVKLTDSTYLWADVERTEGADIDEEWRGTVGIRYSF